MSITSDGETISILQPTSFARVRTTRVFPVPRFPNSPRSRWACAKVIESVASQVALMFIHETRQWSKRQLTRIDDAAQWPLCMSIKVFLHLA